MMMDRFVPPLKVLFIILAAAYLPGLASALVSKPSAAFPSHRIASTTSMPVLSPISTHHSRRRWSKSHRHQRLFSSSNDKNDDERVRKALLRSSSDDDSASLAASASRRNFVINAVALGLLGASGVASYSLFQTSVYTPAGFRRLPRTQFIGALGDPKASEGTGATSWGIWKEDPGPRGVWLKDYNSQIVQNNNIAPVGWTYDPNDWWLEEHGLIMEAPKFPLKEGRYLVTGGRMVTTGLTIDSNGGWKLDEGTLYDVTHLPCRSAKYVPKQDAATDGGSPLAANPRDFPVIPGAAMPEVPGCSKQDYAVLFVVGKAESS